MKHQSYFVAALMMTLGCTTLNIDEEASQVVGGGSEPTWDITMTQENDITYAFQFSLNDKSENYQGKAMLADSQASRQQFVGKTEDHQPISITVEDTPCAEIAEVKFDAAIIVDFQDQRLEGCGTSNAR